MTNLESSLFLSLIDQLAEKLTHDIITGVYLPGERLKEQEIASRMGVSRAPLRETFRVLERNGLVEIMPRRGVRVVEPSAEEVKELFEARADMFSLCASRVAQHGDAKAVKEIETHIQMLIERTNAGCDERTYKTLTNDISSMMYGAINNRYLSDMMLVLRQKMFWHYCYLGTSTLERRNDSNLYWADLAKALKSRDVIGASQAAQTIMNASKEFALYLLSKQEIKVA